MGGWRFFAGEMGWWNVDIDRKGRVGWRDSREFFKSQQRTSQRTNGRTDAMHTRGEDERESAGKERKKKGRRKEGRKEEEGGRKKRNYKNLCVLTGASTGPVNEDCNLNANR